MSRCARPWPSWRSAGRPSPPSAPGRLHPSRELDGQPMCGVLDVSARMSERLTLGYRTPWPRATARSPSPERGCGGTSSTGPSSAAGRRAARLGTVRAAERRVEGFVQQGVHASYLHTHWRHSPVSPVGSWRGAGRHEQQVDRNGVGSGDPELVTVKGVKTVLRAAEVVVVPVMAAPDGKDGGEPAGGGHRPALRARGEGRPRRVRAQRADRPGAARGRRDAAGTRVAELLRRHVSLPSRPSAIRTCTPPSPIWRSRPSGSWCPALVVETVPGITAMQDLAARSGAVLTEGTEPLTLVPVTAGSTVLRMSSTGPGPSSRTSSGGRRTRSRRRCG